jgi:hypothetical protein
MRFTAPLLAITILSSLSLRADGLSELKAALAAQAGQGAVRARIEYSVRQLEGDDKDVVKMEGKAATVVEDSPQGMRIFWDRATMAAAAGELAARAADPDKKAPTRRVMDALDPQTLSDYLNAVPNLQRKLEGAQLVEEREDTLEGRKLRLLVLKLQPKLTAQDKKYVKQAESTARIWVDADGLPVASESHFLVKGRAFLVITFDSSEDSHLRFGRVAGRLVVLHHEKTSGGAGGGEKSSETIKADLKVEPLGP